MWAGDCDGDVVERPKFCQHSHGFVEDPFDYIYSTGGVRHHPPLSFRPIVREIHVTKTREGVVGIIYANRIQQYEGRTK